MDEPSLLHTLARMALKNGVGLGTLPADDRPLALACAWACMPAGTLREGDVNLALRQALTEALCWLETDHVELRRWLVDADWLTRDGFGRVYQRIEINVLPVHLQATAQAVSGLDITAWVWGARQRHQAERSSRRLAWEHAS